MLVCCMRVCVCVFKNLAALMFMLNNIYLN